MKKVLCVLGLLLTFGTAHAGIALPNLLSFPKQFYWYYNDFLGNPNTTGGDGALSEANYGGYSGMQQNTYPTRVGILETGTGSFAGSRGLLSSELNIIKFGEVRFVLEMPIRFEDACDALDTYQAIAGFISTRDNVNQTYGAYFLYDCQGVATGAAASHQFQTVTVHAGTRTVKSTTITVNSDQWYTLKIDIDAPALTAKFIIDGTVVNTHTTNIPTDAVGFGHGIFSSANVSGRRKMYSDYYNVVGDIHGLR